MSVFYTVEAKTKLSKESVSKDPKALIAIREIEKAYASDMDIVELYDTDDTCDLVVEFLCPERTDESADRIGEFLEIMAPHATEPFQIIGENQDRGEFVDVDGDRERIIDEAIRVGQQSSLEALPLPDAQLEHRLEKAMRYAGEQQSDAVHNLIALIRVNEDCIDEGVMNILETALKTLEESHGH